MLYLVIFFILNASVCLYSSEPWENFVDRLDLLIRDSYLIIQCNENEVQIIHLLTTFDELKSNLKCTNKDELFKHGIEKMQIIDLEKVVISCHNKIVRFEVHFKQVKVSLSKIHNGVDWPFVHTPYTKEIKRSDPNKLKFLDKEEIIFILTEIKNKELPKEKQTLFIHLDFVNRPMICRMRITGVKKKTNDDECEPKIIDDVFEPVCYYKVDGENTPSHEELIQIIDKTSHYVKSSKTNYTYISNINTFIDSTDHVEENIIEKTNSSKKKKKKSEKLSSKDKKESGLSLIVIIGIIIICLIVIIIGIIFFYKKYFKEKENDQLAKQLSDSSHESQISVSSNKSDSIKSQSDLPPSPVKQFHNKKQKPGRQAAANWFKLDEDI